MSNPTTPFSWQMPTSTDLVTDLPADFEVFGQAVATSMADLLGGTTGQILSKASNTDMDFTWIANDQGDITAVTAGTGISGGGTSGAVTITNSMATAITTAGDTLYGTGSGTFSRLGIGSTGQVLTVAAGVPSWATASAGSTNVAGKNGVLNSALNVWQRGTSIAIPASSSLIYTADRWETSTNASQACTVSRQATGDTTNLPNIQYALRFQRNSGQTGTGGILLTQSFETVNSVQYAGKVITMSFYARAGANYSATSNALAAIIYSGTGTDQNILSGFTGSTNPINGTATLTTTWQRFTFTSTTIPTNSTQLGVAFYYTPTGTASTNDYYEVTGVQIEIASTATAYSPNAATFQQELAACQRYYYLHASGNSQTIGLATYNRSNQMNVSVQMPVTMRTTPTLSATSGTNYYSIDQATTDYLDSLTLNLGSTTVVSLYNNTNVSGTAGTAFLINTANASASVAFSSEL